jgi:hypothetical protein
MWCIIVKTDHPVRKKKNASMINRKWWIAFYHCAILIVSLTWVQVNWAFFLVLLWTDSNIESQLFLKSIRFLYSTKPSDIIPTFSCSNIVDVSSYDELKAAITLGKWARGPWSARYYFVILLLVVDKEAQCISIILADLHACLILCCNCWL